MIDNNPIDAVLRSPGNMQLPPFEPSLDQGFRDAGRGLRP